MYCWHSFRFIIDTLFVTFCFSHIVCHASFVFMPPMRSSTYSSSDFPHFVFWLLYFVVNLISPFLYNLLCMKRSEHTMYGIGFSYLLLNFAVLSSISISFCILASVIIFRWYWSKNTLLHLWACHILVGKLQLEQERVIGTVTSLNENDQTHILPRERF